MTDTLKYHCYSGQYEYDKRLSNLIPVNMKINLKRWQGWLWGINCFMSEHEHKQSRLCVCVIAVLTLCNYLRIRGCHYRTISSTLGWVEERCAEGLLLWGWQHMTPSPSRYGCTSLLKPGVGPGLRTIARREEDRRDKDRKRKSYHLCRPDLRKSIRFLLFVRVLPQTVLTYLKPSHTYIDFGPSRESCCDSALLCVRRRGEIICWVCLWSAER